MGQAPAFIDKEYPMTFSPEARAQQDWQDGLSSDHNPYAKNTPEREAYAWEHHRLVHEEFIRDFMVPTYSAAPL